MLRAFGYHVIVRDLCDYDNCNLKESLQGNLSHLSEQWAISPNLLLTLSVDLRNLNVLLTHQDNLNKNPK